MDRSTMNFNALREFVQTSDVKTTANAYVPEARELEYYAFNKKTGADTEKIRGLLASECLNVDYDIDEDGAGSLFFTILECLFPGIIVAIMKSLEGLVVKATTISDEEVESIVNLHKGAVSKLGSDENLDFDSDSEPVDNFLLLFPQLTMSEHSLSTANSNVNLVKFCSVLFAVGKAPTDANSTAFTQNRVRALKSYLGLEDVLITQALEPANMPNIHFYKKIHSFFNHNIGCRRSLVNLLIGWESQSNNDHRIGAILSITKLWKNQGTMHILMIRNLLMSYGNEIITEIREISAEVADFLTKFTNYRANQNASHPYAKVLGNPEVDALRSRDFPELMKLAKQLHMRHDRTFVNYAPGLAESNYLDRFKEILERSQTPETKPRGEEAAEEA